MSIVSKPYTKEGEDTWDRVYGKKEVVNKTFIYTDSMKRKRCTCNYGDVVLDIVNLIYKCDNCGVSINA